uniref:Uncharacterized protein n=1 Tax=Arundo donax TaxID=35708 RepID=A0A0A9HM30_ARUDO
MGASGGEARDHLRLQALRLPCNLTDEQVANKIEINKYDYYCTSHSSIRILRRMRRQIHMERHRASPSSTHPRMRVSPPQPPEPPMGSLCLNRSRGADVTSRGEPQPPGPALPPQPHAPAPPPQPQSSSRRGEAGRAAHARRTPSGPGSDWIAGAAALAVLDEDEGALAPPHADPAADNHDHPCESSRRRRMSRPTASPWPHRKGGLAGWLD